MLHECITHLFQFPDVILRVIEFNRKLCDKLGLEKIESAGHIIGQK